MDNSKTPIKIEEDTDSKNTPKVDLNEVAEEIGDVVNQFPEEMRSAIQIMAGSGPAYPPFMKNIDGEHLHKMFDLADKEMSFVFKDRSMTRYLIFGGFLVIIALFIFLTIYLVKDHPGVFNDILKFGLAFVGGFGSGWGVFSYRALRK